MGNVLGPPVNHWKYSVLTPFMLTSFPRLVLCVNSYDRPLEELAGQPRHRVEAVVHTRCGPTSAA
jgi:hypothetical protein